MDRDDLLRKIKEMGPKDSAKRYQMYKLWAFHTAYNIRLKTLGNRRYAGADAFCLAIAWTGDSGACFHEMETRELHGFIRWDQEVRILHGERIREGHRKRRETMLDNHRKEVANDLRQRRNDR